MNGRRRHIAILIAALAAAVAELPAADSIGPPDTRIGAVARRLSSAEYSQRQTAEAQLLALGPDAIPELKRLLGAVDLEAQYRLERIIASLERNLRETALSDLRAGRPPADPQLLAGWAKFVPLVGDSPDSRELFVDMVNIEPWLVGALAGDVDQLRRDFERRCADVHLRRIQHQESHRPVAGVAALLLAANQPDCHPSATAIACITACVQEGAFFDAMQGPDRPAAVERLLAAWVCDPQSSNALQRLNLADRFDLVEGLDIAVQIIEQRLPGPQLQHAILYLAKTGNTSHLHPIELLINDKTELQMRRMSQGSQPVTTFTSRIQDFALVALLRLTGQDPRDYGFSGLRENPQPQSQSQYLYQPGTIGFESEEQRREAIVRWKRWSADNLKEVQPYVEQAALGYST
jgi:hypothetical protein